LSQVLATHRQQEEFPGPALPLPVRYPAQRGTYQVRRVICQELLAEESVHLVAREQRHSVDPRD